MSGSASWTNTAGVTSGGSQVRGLGGGAVFESHRRPDRRSVFPAGTGNGGLPLVCPGSGSLPSHGEEPDPCRRAAGAGQQPEPETQICLPAVRPGPRREDLQNRAAAGAEGDAGAAGDGGAAAEHRGARHPGGRPGPGRRHLLRRVQEVAGESEHRSEDERSLPGVKISFTWDQVGRLVPNLLLFHPGPVSSRTPHTTSGQNPVKLYSLLMIEAKRMKVSKHLVKLVPPAAAAELPV